MSSSVKCAVCGASNATDYSFCIKCGNKFTHIEFPGKSQGFQTSKIEGRLPVHSSNSFPLIPRKGASINYKLLGIGFIILIGFGIGGFILFGTFLDNLFSYTYDSDDVTQVLTDSQGNIFVLGRTNSLDFPSTFNDTSKLNSSYYWNVDAFITKFSPDGELIWSRVIGGYYEDACRDGAIDTEGNIIVMGYTDSYDFPVTKEWSHNEYSNTFLLKLAPNGTILWSSIISARDWDKINGMTLDSQDNIILTGSIYGNSTFPTATYNVLNPDSENVLIHKITSNGSLIWTYVVGGTYDDCGNSVEVDNTDNIIVSGVTYSTDFPSTGTNSYHNETTSQRDFILKISSNTELMWSNLIGGSGWDESLDLLVNNDFIFMSGITYSSDFPIINATTEVEVDYNEWRQVGFIVKYSSDGSLLWSNCFGTESYFNHFVLDGNESIIGIGSEYYPDSSSDCFLWIISQTNSSNSQKITFGGNDYDRGIAINNLDDNCFLLAGTTRSRDFPLGETNKSTIKGEEDVFVLIYDLNDGIQWGILLGGSGRDNGMFF
jgi:hypothetical protein